MSLSPRHERPIPQRPYRTTVLVHGSLALVVVAFALLTGGGFAKAIAVAAAYFVLATAWTWWQFRRQIRRSSKGTQ